MATVLVIYPGPDEETASSIRAALSLFDVEGAPAIACVPLPGAPSAIETAEDADAASMLVCDAVMEHSADAYVVADYADTGLDGCAMATDKPVFGLQEATARCIQCLPGTFGVIEMSGAAKRRNARYLKERALDGGFAGARVARLTARDRAGTGRALEKLERAGAALRDKEGVSAVILGDVGLSAYRACLEDALGIRVIDPVQAAAGMAIGRVLV